jgi:hypothetical protein
VEHAVGSEIVNGGCVPGRVDVEWRRAELTERARADRQ